MSTGTINDTRIRMQPSKKLLQLIEEHKDTITELPENITKALKRNGYSIPNKVEILKSEATFKQAKINTALLADLLSGNTSTKAEEEKVAAEEEVDEDVSDSEAYLHLCDLRWLNGFLAQLRKDQGLDVYLHNFLESCRLELPENDIIERNPELEARCQRLRDQQQNRDYRKMTKNVDAALKYYPEDTIAYQMKAINSQIIAVLQFVFSVVAGFVFGFLGIELIIGNMDFGLRLLLGIMCALIIALAEIYFLAKKLNEYDNVPTFETLESTPVKTRKAHVD